MVGRFWNELRLTQRGSSAIRSPIIRRRGASEGRKVHLKSRVGPQEKSESRSGKSLRGFKEGSEAWRNHADSPSLTPFNAFGSPPREPFGPLTPSARTTPTVPLR